VLPCDVRFGNETKRETEIRSVYIDHVYKMHSEAADVAPVLPPGDLDQTTLFDVQLVPQPGELNETYSSSFIRAYSLHYMTSSTHDVIHKTGSI